MSELVDRVKVCTDEYAVGVDWGAFLNVCDLANASDSNAKTIVKAIRERLKKKPPVQLLALELLATLVKNAPRAHAHVGAKDVQKQLVALATARSTDIRVRDAVTANVQAWAHAFQRFDVRCAWRAREPNARPCGMCARPRVCTRRLRSLLIADARRHVVSTLWPHSRVCVKREYPCAHSNSMPIPQSSRRRPSSPSTRARGILAQRHPM